MNQVHSSSKPKILVAPLDWGLGHATRCVPIIKELQAQDCEVVIAADGKQKELLQAEFPDLLFLPLEGYQIKYAKRRIGLWAQMFFQIPRILSSINKENSWLQKQIKEHTIGAVISDNRYGLYHTTVPSVIITHQLTIQIPFSGAAENILQKLNYRFLNRFSTCWVPDEEGENNLSGELSHPMVFPKIPVEYIGPISRFSTGNNSKEEHILILLSGPEPQRSLLEKILLLQCKKLKQKIVFVRGLPGALSVPYMPAHVSIFNHLPSHELEAALQHASFIVGRCGYSTIMDLVQLKKKSILIATPGQTEQEYLAEHVMKKKLAYCIEQRKLDLEQALVQAQQFEYQLDAFPDTGNVQLQKAIQKLLQKIK